MLNNAVQDIEQDMDANMVKLLEHRYGDGQVYLPRHQPATLLDLAKQKGFLDNEGYLTRKGRTLLAKYA